MRRQIFFYQWTSAGLYRGTPEEVHLIETMSEDEPKSFWDENGWGLVFNVKEETKTSIIRKLIRTSTAPKIIAKIYYRNHTEVLYYEDGELCKKTET